MKARKAMKVAYVHKTSFIDYPGKVCAVVFTQGCNFRCAYCHNPELVDPDIFTQCMLMEDVYSYLEKRKGQLDAVVISGGEPSVQPDLIPFVTKIKSMDYLVKLDTNGSKPNIIRELIKRKLIDYVAMDIKAPYEKYSQVVGSLVNITRIEESIALIMGASIPYEFRTTLESSLLSIDDVLYITNTMIRGARLYVLQNFVSSKHLNNQISQSSFTDDEVNFLITQIGATVNRCITR